MRVLLDTNVWSDLGRERVRPPEVERLAASLGARIVVAPATLLEVLRGRGGYDRDATVRLLAYKRWVRLPTEAESESKELADEVARLRPEWMRAVPDQECLDQFHRFWAQDVWKEAVRRPDLLHFHEKGETVPVVEHLTRVQTTNRDPWRDSGIARQAVDEIQVVVGGERSAHDASFVGVDPEHDRLPWWRVKNAALYWEQLAMSRSTNALVGKRSTQNDWVGAYVDLGRLRESRASFNELWFYEIEREAVPRNWLRLAVEHAQMSKRIGSGNPGDSQLAAYLLDCDVFITADRRFHQILSDLCGDCPFRMPHLLLIGGDSTKSLNEIHAGLISIIGRLSGVYPKGIENFSTRDADWVIRQLKRGWAGVARLLRQTSDGHSALLGPR